MPAFITEVEGFILRNSFSFANLTEKSNNPWFFSFQFYLVDMVLYTTIPNMVFKHCSCFCFFLCWLCYNSKRHFPSSFSFLICLPNLSWKYIVFLSILQRLYFLLHFTIDFALIAYNFHLPLKYDFYSPRTCQSPQNINERSQIS